MRRRIQKSKRHKKVKAIDPFYTGERKKLLDRKAHLANDKPQNVDEQEIPRKLQEIMQAKKQLENNVKKKQIKKRKVIDEVKGDYFGEAQPGMIKPLKPVPLYKKKKTETENQFMSRVCSQTYSHIEKLKLEEKLGVDFIEKPDGKVEVKKREKFSLYLPQKLSTEKKECTSRKIIKRRENEKLKKQKKLQNKKEDDFEDLKDDISFGEVVMCPPSLKFKPRNSSSISSKPGKKPLLLKQMLPGIRQQSVIFPPSGSTSIDRTVKRKMLSLCDRRQLDAERDKVIAAYRSSKKKSVTKTQEK